MKLVQQRLKKRVIEFLDFQKFGHVHVLLLGVVSFTLLFSYLAIQKHNAFASGYDLGNMDQTVWNTSQGRFFSFTLGPKTVSRLATHADIFLVFLTPLYFLYSNVRTLLVFQAFALALGAVPTYLIANYIFKNKNIALIFSIIYLLNPSIHWTNIYDFHSVAIAIPLLLFTFYFGLKSKWKWFALFAFLAILTKENVALTVGAIGLTLSFIHKNKNTLRIGIGFMIFGFLYSFLMIKKIIPSFSMNGYMYGGWYLEALERVRGTPPYLVPIEMIKNYLLTTDALSYLYLLLRPFGFLSILGFPLMLMSSPDLAINLLSDHAEMRSIMMHYDSAVIPGIVVSAIYGAYFWSFLVKKNISRNDKLQKYLLHLPIYIALLVSLVVFYRSSPIPSFPNCYCQIYNVTKEDTLFEEVLSDIPRNSSITASPEIRPHVSQREYSYTLPEMSEKADYIAIITQNRLVGDYQPKKFEMELIKKLNKSKNYVLKNQIGHFYLYERTKM
ncbi:MAG: DUF2079 domain-containing protein [Patescibacteria group bacterium]